MEPTRYERNKRSKKNKSKTKKWKIFLFLLIISTLVSSFVLLYPKNKYESPKKTDTAASTTEAKEINPFTGLPLDGATSLKRPIIVSTDNDSYLSRPQAGITDADILHEVPIEGGGSRYEPLYFSKIPKLMGAARSVRPYIVDLARGYKAILVHNGQSPQARAYFPNANTDRISAAEHFQVFHPENLLRLPGNFFVYKKDVVRMAKELNYNKKIDVKPFKWLKNDAKPKNADGNAKSIDVNYADGAYNNFLYNEKTDKYKKTVKGIPLSDMNNSKTYTCSNILVQVVSAGKYDALRLNINMCLGGKAYLFTKGKIVEGTWKRDSLDSPTVWMDNRGNIMKLSPGKTAIQVIDSSVKFKYR